MYGYDVNYDPNHQLFNSEGYLSPRDAKQGYFSPRDQNGSGRKGVNPLHTFNAIEPKLMMSLAKINNLKRDKVGEGKEQPLETYEQKKERIHREK